MVEGFKGSPTGPEELSLTERSRLAALQESEMLADFEHDLHEGIEGAQAGLSAEELAEINDLGSVDTSRD